MSKTLRNSLLKSVFIFSLAVISRFCLADDSAQPTNSFPTPSEVFQGRQFANKTERDLFFLRAIHDHYPLQWPALLDANITVQDYVQSPDKLLRFVNELGITLRDRDDSAASASLSLITSNKDFYANTNAYHPEILQAAAEALIGFGPNGRKALAGSFNQEHYRDDSESLENLAKIIGRKRPDDPELAKALAETAFDFSTGNGGTYPRCTTEMVKNLLCLPDGPAAVRAHLKTEKVVGDPARFQAVIDGISAAHAVDLSTNLTAVEPGIKTKLSTLTNSPGTYRDDLQELENRIQKTVSTINKPE